MLQLKGVYEVSVISKEGVILDTEIVDNIVMIEGRDALLRVGVVGDLSAPSWYLGLIGANVVLNESDTAASALVSGGVYNEVVAYDETARPQYSAAFSSADHWATNENTPAVFTFNASVTVYGVFITNTATKNDGSGYLLSATMFTSAKDMAAGESLSVVYKISSIV